MSGRPKKEEEKDIWGSLAGGLLLAGGAAAAGFMAYKMFQKDEPQETRKAKPVFTKTNFVNCNTENRSMCEPSPVSAYSFPCSSNNLNDSRAKIESRNQAQWDSYYPEEFDKSSEPEKCFICHVNEIEVEFEPCNHKRVCEDCAERIPKTCPICYSQITSIIPVYL